MPGLLLITTAGLHVPVIPFNDILGKVGTAPPAQIFNDVPKLNVGVVRGITFTVIVIGIPHWPPVGVKVYAPVALLLIIAGFHAPPIPLPDVDGKVGGVVPAHIGGMDVKVGMNIGFDKTMPIKRLVVHPLITKEKFE